MLILKGVAAEETPEQAAARKAAEAEERAKAKVGCKCVDRDV
jgi:hypothetical protein